MSTKDRAELARAEFCCDAVQAVCRIGSRQTCGTPLRLIYGSGPVAMSQGATYPGGGGTVWFPLG